MVFNFFLSYWFQFFSIYKHSSLLGRNVSNEGFMTVIRGDENSVTRLDRRRWKSQSQFWQLEDGARSVPEI